MGKKKRKQRLADHDATLAQVRELLRALATDDNTSEPLTLEESNAMLANVGYILYITPEQIIYVTPGEHNEPVPRRIVYPKD